MIRFWATPLRLCPGYQSNSNAEAPNLSVRIGSTHIAGRSICVCSNSDTNAAHDAEIGFAARRLDLREGDALRLIPATDVQNPVDFLKTNQGWIGISQ